MQKREKIKEFLYAKLNSLLAADAECIFCGEEAVTDEFGVCSACAVKLREAEDISYILYANKYLDGINAAFAYDSVVAKGIARFKYKSDPSVARRFASFLSVDSNWCIDVGIAVPMYAKKKRQRGYNQSELLAENLCKRLNLEYNPFLLKRVKSTESQMGSTREERMIKQANSFEANVSFCKDKSILIVDDVCTTGSTVNECARVLKENGAVAVYVSVLAHGKY